MIRFGKEENIAELKKLWKTCFGDEDAYINAFFAALYNQENVLLAEEKGMLMGASFFLPGKIYQKEGEEEGHWQEIRYVYALAVYPKFRGRGIARKLLSTAYECYHAPLIAEPAEKGLIGGFYEPIGFSASFYLRKKQIPLPQYNIRAAELYIPQPCYAQSRQIQVHAAKAAEYSKIRKKHFLKTGYIHWPLEHIAFAIQEHRANDGDALVITENGKEDLLLYHIEGHQAVVTETTFTQQQVIDTSNIWLQKQCDTLLLTCEAEYHKDIQPDYDLMGMIYGMPAVCGYLNLSLD